MRLWRALVLSALCLLPAEVFAQATPSGKFTPGHTSRTLTPDGTVFGDAGGAAGGPAGTGLSELGITNTGTPFCINSGPTNSAGGYYQDCWGASALGGGLISHNALGGAAQTPFLINVNGATYNFPPAGNGNVLGPNSSIINGLAVFNSTDGKTVKYVPTGVQLQAGTMSGPPPWTNTLYESTPGDVAALLGSIWNPGTTAFLGVSTRFAAANDPTGANLGSPRFGEMVVTHHNNSAAATVPFGAMNVVDANATGQPFAANFVVNGSVAMNGAGTAWNGVEIDVQPQVGSTNIQSNGLILNAFNVAFTAGLSPAIEIGGINGGKWGTGIYEQAGTINGGVGLELGAASTTAPSISQSIKLHALTSAPATTSSSIVADVAGNIELLADALTMGAQGFVIANPRMAVGMTIPIITTPPVPFQVRSATDENILIRGHQDLVNGSTISSVNGANNAFEPIEIQAAIVEISNGPLATFNSIGTPVGIILGLYSGPPPGAGSVVTGLPASAPSQAISLGYSDSGGNGRAIGISALGGNTPTLSIVSSTGTALVESSGTFVAGAMPTSCTSQPVGTLWNSSGTVHVC